MLLAGLLVTASAPARADEAAKPYRLAYHAHPGCPSDAAFVDAVARRLKTAARDAGAKLAITVEITRKGARSHGVLVADDGALRTERDVEAPTCQDAVEALAFIATVAIDGATASIADATGESDAPADAAVEVAPAPPPSPSPSASASAPTEAADETPEVEPTLPVTTHVAPSIGLGVIGALLPGLATTTSLTASVGAAWLRGRGLSPALFLAFGRTAQHALAGVDGAHARWTWGRLDACPHVFSPSPTTALTACATFTMGLLEASARPFDEVDPVRRPWMAVGALARVTTWFGPIGQSLEIGLDVPLRRDQFVSARNGQEVAVPAIAPMIGLSLVGRIP